jgi:hypothetical protein
MRSHTYTFTLKELMRHVGLMLLPLGIFSLSMHFGAATGVLPRPLPALDADRTILLNKAQASLQPGPANVLLLGDSSCLMNVSASEVSRALDNVTAMNLGTLSYLDLGAFGLMLKHYLAANPDQVRTVVLLMHPEALRRPGGTEYHIESLLHYYDGRDYCGPGTAPHLCALGVEIFRGRILSRVMPQPLQGAFGRHYGFTHDLWKRLGEQDGSALDPNTFESTTDAAPVEYRLARNLEGASRQFRAIVPARVTLMVGITPVPESLAGRGFNKRQAEMLETWREWLQADFGLYELPSTWPDALFASSTHLNAQGVELYTKLLVKAVSERLPAN